MPWGFTAYFGNPGSSSIGTFLDYYPEYKNRDQKAIDDMNRWQKRLSMRVKGSRILRMGPRNCRYPQRFCSQGNRAMDGYIRLPACLQSLPGNQVQAILNNEVEINQNQCIRPVRFSASTHAETVPGVTASKPICSSRLKHETHTGAAKQFRCFSPFAEYLGCQSLLSKNLY